MTVKPLYNRVLLRRKDPEETSKGGLVIPTAAQDKSNFAEVIAVGHGHLNEDGTVTALKVEPGMTVLMGKWGGDEIKLDGETLLIAREDDILAVVSDG